MADKTTAGGLAPVDHEGELAIAIPPALDPRGGMTSVWCSYNPKNDVEKAALMAALQGAIPKLSTQINKTLHVQNIARQAVKMIDRNSGEVIDGIRTVLFTPEGEAFATVAGGVGNSLGLLIQFWGTPPWYPPIPLKVLQQDLEGGKRLFQLAYDMDTPRQTQHGERQARR